MDKAFTMGLAASLGIGLIAALNVPRADDAYAEAGSTGILDPAFDFEQPLIGSDLTARSSDPGSATAAPNWSPNQATGPPNTLNAGGIPTAWASKTPDGQNEWLELIYRRPVRPVAVVVFETYNPGAVSQIVLFDESGEEITVWGDDPRPVEVPKRVLVAPISAEFATDRIKLYLLSTQVPGWNEIDAVGLLDDRGQMHWAIGVTASSSWADLPPEEDTKPSSAAVLRRRLELVERELDQTRREFAFRLDELQREHQDLRSAFEQLSDDH